MTNSTFTSNLYGAIRLEKSRLIASEVKILENGGVVGREWYWQVSLFDQAHLKIEKSSIEHGETGGIYAENSEVEIADCIVADHQLDGLRVNDSSTAKVVGGTFRANRGAIRLQAITTLKWRSETQSWMEMVKADHGLSCVDKQCSYQEMSNTQP
jgi:hypothetical protein